MASERRERLYRILTLIALLVVLLASIGYEFFGGLPCGGAGNPPCITVPAAQPGKPIGPNP
jgi:hypothetical protein